MFKELFTYLETNQPIATLITGVLAIFAVILSQLWLDWRQTRAHKHEVSLKDKELDLKKKEELIETINIQVLDIARVEDVFDSWFNNFSKNYTASEMSQLLMSINIRLDKIHILIQLYFPCYIPYINKIMGEAQGFLELCADFSMAAKFGSEGFHKLEMIEIIEKCNEYAVAYMHLSSHVIEPELIEKYQLKPS
ncbi:hypothetical protein HHE92_15250 [Pseudoalteromonas arctica]|uniref:hypothetical protein n=1 Tax=Pseudoalteromonas arctica TaxID=394751 RepID=UPI00145C1FEE|nr:hypothetical protein [Pseudoalteromonas arctica]NMP81144.1 hypothetical protein [Pseudoalteromonas arctica]